MRKRNSAARAGALCRTALASATAVAEFGLNIGTLMGTDGALRRRSATSRVSPLSTSKLSPEDLDHVFAADRIKFKKFAGGNEVKVKGWVDKHTEAQRDKWIREYSDHAILYFEVL